jgi:DNA replication protein DnaC
MGRIIRARKASGCVPFGEWGKIFTDKTMTLAAIDRLVHHATILEMNVESCRRKAALKRKRGKGN